MEPERDLRLRAWEPLGHVRAAQELLDHHDMFEEHREWVLFWVAGIALLRAVGHVLDKVDGARCPQLKKIIAGRWATWKADKNSHAIFWDFVEDERNNILKAFEMGVEGIDQMPIVCEGVPTSGEKVTSTHNIDVLLHSSGEDGRDLMWEAIEWWQAQLSAIETEWKLVKGTTPG